MSNPLRSALGILLLLLAAGTGCAFGASKPGAPIFAIVNSKNTTVSVFIRAPSNNGGSPVLRFRIQGIPVVNGKLQEVLIILNGNQATNTPITLTAPGVGIPGGLRRFDFRPGEPGKPGFYKQGMTYRFRAFAINAVGEGPAGSSITNFLTPTRPPCLPVFNSVGYVAGKVMQIVTRPPPLSSFCPALREYRLVGIATVAGFPNIMAAPVGALHSSLTFSFAAGPPGPGRYQFGAVYRLRLTAVGTTGLAVESFNSFRSPPCPIPAPTVVLSGLQLNVTLTPAPPPCYPVNSYMVTGAPTPARTSGKFTFIGPGQNVTGGLRRFTFSPLVPVATNIFVGSYVFGLNYSFTASGLSSNLFTQFQGEVGPLSAPSFITTPLPCTPETPIVDATTSTIKLFVKPVPGCHQTKEFVINGKAVGGGPSISMFGVGTNLADGRVQYNFSPGNPAVASLYVPGTTYVFTATARGRFGVLSLPSQPTAPVATLPPLPPSPPPPRRPDCGTECYNCGVCDPLCSKYC